MSDFNLVDEKWLTVTDSQCRPEEVSLSDLFLHAQDYSAVDGDNGLQTVAILRLLLAVSITLLYRYDENGELSELKKPNEALERWKNVYKKGCFPRKAVEDYFRMWHERFWLFDESYPFFQVPKSQVKITAIPVKKGKSGSGDTAGEAQFKVTGRRSGKAPTNVQDFDEVFDYTWVSGSKISGIICESANKINAAAIRKGKWKSLMTPAEAARWLVYQMSYADCGSVGKGNDRNKAKKEKGIDDEGKPALISLKSAEMTAASRGCIVYANGHNLFETLMLNSCLVKDPLSKLSLYGSPSPSWEQDRELLNKIRRPVPDNLPELFTQQSRRFILHCMDDGYVDGAFGAMGDVWNDRSMEPMFIRYLDKKDGKVKNRRYTADTVAWQNCEYFLLNRDESGSCMLPGIVNWNYWVEDELDSDRFVTFNMADLEYGTMNSSVANTFFGSVSLNSRLCSDETSADEILEVLNSIKTCAKKLFLFGQELAIAGGSDVKLSQAKVWAKRAESDYYNVIGTAFIRFITGETDLKKVIDDEFKAALNTMDNFAEQNVTVEMMRGHQKESFGHAYGLCKGGILKERKKMNEFLKSIDGGEEA